MLAAIHYEQMHIRKYMMFPGEIADNFRIGECE